MLSRLFILLITISFLHLNSHAQTTIRLILKNETGLPLEKCEVFDLSQKQILKQDYADSLVFHFNSKLPDAYTIRYTAGEKMYRRQCWLNPGDISLYAHISGEDVEIDTVLNAPFYYKMIEFSSTYKTLYNEKDTAKLNEYLLSVFAENINNPFSLNAGMYFTMLNMNNRPELKRLKVLTDKQGGLLKNHLLYDGTVERLNKLLDVLHINLNRYRFQDSLNHKVPLKLTGAGYFILDFWFLNCPPCVAQHREINTLLDSLAIRNVKMISISIDSDHKAWTAYLKKHSYHWLNLRESTGAKLTKDLEISGYPTYLLVNKDGDILGNYSSFGQLKAWLKMDSDSHSQH